MAGIRRKVEKQSGRNQVSRLVHARNDKDKIAAWRAELNRILLVFNVRSVAFTWLSLIDPFSDRAELKYSCGSFRYSGGDLKHPCGCFRNSRRCIEHLGGDQRSGSPGKSQFIPSTRKGCLRLARPKLGQQLRYSRNRLAPRSHSNIAFPENHLPHNSMPVSDVAT